MRNLKSNLRGTGVFSGIAVQLMLSSFIQDHLIVRPRNLFRRRLHKSLVLVGCCKLRYIFKVSNRISFCFGEGSLNISGKIFNEFIAPRLMPIDDATNAVIEQNKLFIDIQRCLILCLPDFLFDQLNQV